MCHPIHRRLRRGKRRRAFTLVEMLVAMAVTLILIFALAQAFALVGDTVAKGRATIEMAGNLRAVANRLQADLDGVTVAVRPWVDAESGEGYFEVGEGPLSSAFLPSSDKDWDGNGIYEVAEDRDGNGTADMLEDPATGDTTLGDLDDWLSFTTRNTETPFIGALGGSVIRSTDAEVVWWIQYEDIDEGGTFDPGEKLLIYRRVMLIRPDQGVVLNRVGPTGPSNPGAFQTDQVGLLALKTALFTFYNENDISVRINSWVDTNGVNVRLTANSLADLTKRKNRFAHRQILSDRSPSLPVNQQLNLPAVAADGVYDNLTVATFPYPMDVNRRSVTSLYRAPKFGANGGEDVMVSDVLAFDVRVFDPEAPIRPGNTGEAMVPSDPGYFVGWVDNNFNDDRPDDMIGLGAFVDLGYGAQFAYAATPNIMTPRFSSLFSDRPHWRSGFSPTNPAKPAGKPYRYVYCTWSTDFERNGVDEDGSGVADQGTNGLDDDSANGVDDVGERETSPPYTTPLRGIQVKVRAIDPDTRQIRQVTVVSDFIPE